MKMKNLFSILMILAALGLASCAESTSTASSSAQDSGDGAGGDSGGGTSGGGSGGGASGGSTSGPTCFGNSNDGEGDGYPLYSLNVLVAGEGEGNNNRPNNTWKPYSNGSQVSGTEPSYFINLREASEFFTSDAKVNVRVKLHAQPNPTSGKEYCYGRVTGQAADANKYTKVKFKISLRDIVCQPGESLANNDCELGPRYMTKTVGPVSVDSCSSVLQLGHLRNTTDHGTTVEIWDVRTDQTCAYNDQDCPVDDLLRSSSCWEATLQVATDYTQNFKN